MQKKQIELLLTADLSHDSGARRATTNLAVALLRSGLAGSGPLAARIVLSINGAGPGLKPALRKAFDAYVDKHPKGLNKGDLRRLNELGLLTPRKRSLLADLLGWHV
jgi:hypothetical protein